MRRVVRVFPPVVAALVLLSSGLGGAGATVGPSAGAGPYPLEFIESGLPAGVWWTLWIDGVSFYSNSTTISLYEPVGAHAIQLSAYNGETLARISGPHAPQPSWLNTTGPSTFQVLFATNETLTFNATGLPPNVPWTVTITPAAGHAGPGPQTWSSNVAMSYAPLCGNQVGSRCRGVVYNPVTKKEFVSVAGPSNGYVEVYNLSVPPPLGPLVAVDPINGTPGAMVIDSLEGQVYVASSTSSGSGELTVISDRSGPNQVTATIPLGGSPLNLAYDRVQDEVFVENSTAPVGFDYSMSVVDPVTNTVSQVLSLPFGAVPGGMAFDPALDQLFFATGSGVARLYASNNSYGPTIVAPRATNVVAVSSFSLEIAEGAGCPGIGDVVTVNPANGTQVSDTVLPGFCPAGLAFDYNLDATFVGSANSSGLLLLGGGVNDFATALPGCPGVALGPSQLTWDRAQNQLLVAECARPLFVNDSAPVSSSQANFTVPAGAVYHFRVTVGSSSLRPIPASGSLRIPAHGVVRTVKFRLLGSAVIFGSKNLSGPGVFWTVTFTTGPPGIFSYPFSQALAAGVGPIRFVLPNGTYTWTVSSTLGTPVPATGTVTVSYPSPPQIFVVRFL